MTFASDLRAAAIEIFDSLTGVPENITYRSLANGSGYVAGGDISPVETPHALRIIKDKQSEFAMALAGEVASGDHKYLFVTAELPVQASKDDKIEFTDGRVMTVVNFEDDAVGAITTLNLRGV